MFSFSIHLKYHVILGKSFWKVLQEDWNESDTPHTHTHTYNTTHIYVYKDGFIVVSKET